MTAKEEAQELISRLPEECSIEDIQYLLALVTDSLRSPKLFQFRGPKSFTVMDFKPIAYVCVPRSSDFGK